MDTNDKPKAKSLFDDLDAEELVQLGAVFREARRQCRAVMSVNWYSLPITHTYAELVAELTGNDPMFGAGITVPEMGPKPHPLCKDQWQVW